MSNAANNYIKKKRAQRPIYLPNVPLKYKSTLSQGVYILDKLNAEDITRYAKVHEQFREYFVDEYFHFVSERAKKESNLIFALNSKTTEFKFENYYRCVTSAYQNKPLSSLGSKLSRVGGRFNIGTIEIGSPFSALYMAENLITAECEFFQRNLNGTEVSLKDFIKTSYSTCRIAGSLSTILDITDTSNLKPFLKVLSKIELDENFNNKAISIGLREATAPVRTMKELENTLLDENWRDVIFKFGIPSNSQSFGELVRKAKIEAVRFKSKFNNGTCLAIFPENLGPSSYIQISDPFPAGVITRLDATTFKDLI